MYVLQRHNQFLIDEMTTSRLFDGTGYWGNKFAFQLGAKYYNAFKVDGLMLSLNLIIHIQFQSHFSVFGKIANFVLYFDS